MSTERTCCRAARRLDGAVDRAGGGGGESGSPLNGADLELPAPGVERP